ncbi:MAG: HAMP domain-containing sensor histidine kinase [Bryobacteraceae bacterium]
MARMMAGLSSGRGLVVLFLGVTILPALALVVLGVRLWHQERIVAEQQRRQNLDHAADHAVRVLEQELAGIRRSVAAGNWGSLRFPDDSAALTIRDSSVRGIPADHLPYLPSAPPLKEVPENAFAEVEILEFARQDLPGALRRYASLAASPNPGIRAGALLREGRILRKLGRGEEALGAARRLEEVREIAFNGMPVELLARRSRCVILADLARKTELADEAGRIRDDLRAGRWVLDRASYELVAEQLERWLGVAVAPRPEQAALAEAAEWLYRRWTATPTGEFPGSGTQVLRGVLVVWEANGGSLNALLAGPTLVQHRLFELAAAEVHPIRLEAGVRRPPDGIRVQRTAAESGLPWHLRFAPDPNEPLQDPVRNQLLLAGFGLLLLLITAGSYLAWRAVSRELAVARLQSDFVAAVSHEFRTPLTTLAHLNDLLGASSEPAAEKRRGYYDAQARATSRLRGLVETLLDFGRMEAGCQPYRFEPLDACAFARDVCESFDAEVSERGFAVEYRACESDLPVMADAEALERALWNLLDNAAKYSGEGRRIVVETKASGGQALIQVIDSGLGIGPDDQARIFEKFTRGEAAREHGIKGTGIGLTMVRHIAEAHGGAVTVSSVKGHGSTFAIVLPLKR